MKGLPTFTLGFKTNIPISVEVYLGWILAWAGWGSWAPGLVWSLLKCERKGLLDLLSQGNTCLHCEAQVRPGPPKLKL